MRILFVLPGLHRVSRGAEVGFESVANEIALRGEHDVTLIGSGESKASRAYRFRRVPAVPRERFERWPTLPFLRNQFMYEELTFAAGLAVTRWRNDADITVTCSYPYTNWALRSCLPGRSRPAHVFVTHNGDWPAYERRREYRFFSCDGLLCTNPIYWERNRERWFSTLIPNSIDPAIFHPGPGDRAHLGLPENRPVVLMVSALDANKRVLEAMQAVAKIPEAFLVVAGDGPLRNEVDRLAAELLPGRFLRRTFPHELMPVLYRSASVFLHTAIRESFPYVCIEALGSGTPIVAHDDEVMRWIFEGHADLIDTTSQDLLVEALQNVLRGPAGGAALRASFALSRYSLSNVAAKYIDFFTNVLARVSR